MIVIHEHGIILYDIRYTVVYVCGVFVGGQDGHFSNLTFLRGGAKVSFCPVPGYENSTNHRISWNE